MKIALLGAAGFLGSAAGQELSRRADVDEIILVDYAIRDAKRLAKALSPKCRWAMADVGKPLELSRLLEGIDAVASAVGPCAEYGKTILLACAGMGVPAASAGDGTLPEPDRREIDAAFRAAGIPAVSGCGLMPGWTELLAAHFLCAGVSPSWVIAPPDLSRFLFFSPDRFGGYAFRRSIAKGIGRPADAPPGAPAGSYFAMEDGTTIGTLEGKAGKRLGLIANTVGKLGPVGKEFAAALLLWLRGSMSGPQGTPAAVTGVASGGRYARVEDPSGRLAALTLVETALLLAARPRKHEGLLPLPELVGREEAERIAKAAGARILAGDTPLRGTLFDLSSGDGG